MDTNNTKEKNMDTNNTKEKNMDTNNTKETSCEQTVGTAADRDGEFQAALKLIKQGGNSLKRGVQQALYKAIRALVYKGDTCFADALSQELAKLENRYYLNIVANNLNAYIGWVDIEYKDGETRFYRRAADKAPLVYNRKLQFWRVQSANKLEAAKSEFEKYFNNVHFLNVKIRTRENKLGIIEKYKLDVKKTLALFYAMRALPENPDLWSEIPEDYQKIIQQLSNLGIENKTLFDTGKDR